MKSWVIWKQSLLDAQIFENYSFRVYFWRYFDQKNLSARPFLHVLLAFLYLGTLCSKILAQALTYTLFCSYMELVYLTKDSILILVLSF